MLHMFCHASKHSRQPVGRSHLVEYLLQDVCRQTVQEHIHLANGSGPEGAHVMQCLKVEAIYKKLQSFLLGFIEQVALQKKQYDKQRGIFNTTQPNTTVDRCSLVHWSGLQRELC